MANAIAPGRDAGSWETRLREAAYTSPAGNRITFSYEAVSREFDKRTTAFDFPGVDDSYVQQNGHSARRYPMRCIFWGKDHDRAATAFEAALLEHGIGRLEHPLYGVFNVVPYGAVTRREDLRNEAGQSVIEVTFWSTVDVVYPNLAADPRLEIQATIADFEIAAADQFARAVNLSGAVNQGNAKASIRKLLGNVSGALQSVSDAVLSVNRAFRDVQSDLNYGLDVLVGQPLLLARQVVNLVKAPGRALTGIESRLAGYGALASGIFGSVAGLPAKPLTTGATLARRVTQIANDFLIADLFALAATAGSVIAVVSQPLDEAGDPVKGPLFTTRPQALTAAEMILQQFEATISWRDTGYHALRDVPGVHGYQVDTGEAYQMLQHAVALTVGYLVQVSFTLVAERRIVLDRPRTILDVCAEVYGAVDSKLDYLIDTNGLTGSDILELQAGQAIVYYAQ